MPRARPGRAPAAAPRSGGAPRGRGSRHRKPAERRSLLSKRQRLAAALVVVAGVLGLGFADGFGGEGSPTPTVASFLLDWQSNHYAAAAALTDGDVTQVSAQLAAAYTDLNATSTIFSLTGVTQHGSTAVATYQATVDLAQAGQQWTYTSKFGLTSKNGKWIVDWAPSVINPHLGPGDRLAVLTSYAPRAGVQDMDGQPLIAKSPDYRVGVYPGKLKDPVATAAMFGQATGLDQQQVLGQIESAPPSDFLSLLTLDPAQYQSLWPKLAKVPGLTAQQQQERLFDSSAQEVVGQVGTENSGALREEGAAYQPGMTVGVSGYEQTFQNELLGTPTTSVVVVNAAGHSVSTLWSSPGGRAGTPVQTTLNSQDQDAAVNALAGAGSSAEIVAIDWSSGQVRVLASHEAGNESLPAGGALDAKVEPGMAFSIVSAAALLSTGVEHEPPAAVRAGGRRRRRDVYLHARHDEQRDVCLGLRRRLRHRVREHVHDPDPAAARERGTGVRHRCLLEAEAADLLRLGPDGLGRGGRGRAGDRHRRRADEPARHGDRRGRGRFRHRALSRAPRE